MISMIDSNVKSSIILCNFMILMIINLSDCKSRFMIGESEVAKDGLDPADEHFLAARN